MLHYRATPHGTTGVSPAEMLFNRKLQTKLPQIHVQVESDEKKKIRSEHNRKKLAQKQYFDKRHRATKKEVAIGDKVLVKQKKSTTKPPYDHHPFTVNEVDGNKVKMSREDGATRVRDKNQIKVLKDRPDTLVPSWETKITTIPDYSVFDFKADTNMPALSAPAEGIQEFPIEGVLVHEESEEEIDDGSSDGQNSSLFDLDGEAEARMQNLLAAATAAEVTTTVAEDNTRVTRSRGLKLNWNPCMNDKNVLLEENSE